MKNDRRWKRSSIRNALSRLAGASLIIVLGYAGTGDVAWAADQTGYRLIGTIRSSTLTGAVLKDSTNAQTFYQLYDKLPDGSTITQIREDSISLKSPDGILYDMYIAHEKIAGSASQPASAEQSISPTAPENLPLDRRPPQPSMSPGRHRRHSSEENEE